MESKSKDRHFLKNRFSAGNMPTQEDFAFLIDSMLNLADDGLSRETGDRESLKLMAGANGGMLDLFGENSEGGPEWQLKIQGTESDLGVFSKNSAEAKFRFSQEGNLDLSGNANLGGLKLPGLPLINSRAALKAIMVDILQEAGFKPQPPEELNPPPLAETGEDEGMVSDEPVNEDSPEKDPITTLQNITEQMTQGIFGALFPTAFSSGSGSASQAGSGSGEELSIHTAPLTQPEPLSQPLFPFKEPEENTARNSGDNFPWGINKLPGEPLSPKIQEMSEANGDGNWQAVTPDLDGIHAFSMVAWLSDPEVRSVLHAIAVTAGPNEMASQIQEISTSNSGPGSLYMLQIRWAMNPETKKIALQIRTLTPLWGAKIKFQLTELIPADQSQDNDG